MTETTATPADATAGGFWASDRAHKRRKARYAADFRLRIYGIAAIGTAILLLGTLLTSLIVTGYLGFIQTRITMPFQITTSEVNPDNLRGSNWRAVLESSIRTEFPERAEENYRAIRDMFTQTVKALASAIDARDPSTKKHSEHVSGIAVEIGQAMGLSEAELEQLEWAGLLHDIGKIGIRDDILLKPERLTREERMLMNEHPVKGEEILKDVDQLAKERPLIRHHHEWYNGSGYPDRLIAEEIPLLARVLHVADAFEAMTASRPYRPVPLTASEALAELHRYAGIQFDPVVVEAFARTKTAQAADSDHDQPGSAEQPLSQVPTLGQVAASRAKMALSSSSAAAES